MKCRLYCGLIAVMCLGPSMAQAQLADLASIISVPGNATDLSTGGVGPGVSRLGGFGSDLFYDRTNNVYYGAADRAYTAATPYDARVQKFTLDVDPNTGAASNFQLLETILFKNADGSAVFDGRGPSVLNGSGGTLGLSLDPEGFVVAPNGNFYVADEYGLSVYEFQPVQVSGATEARFVRAFQTPDNLLPRDENGINFDVEFSEPQTSVLTGRQEGRGYEALAITPSGDKLYTLHQSPLQEEGDSSGRFSRNIRMVEYDVASGESTAQFIYQVESIDAINALIPDDCIVDDTTPANCADLRPNQQGRNVAPSALMAINDHQFLVVERDNRGIGNENASNEDVVSSHVGIKSIFRIDINDASDVSGISLAGTNDLPSGVVPVAKSLFLDLKAELEDIGHLIPEKFEGLTLGPQLSDGQFALLAITDNDRSNVDVANPDDIRMPLLLDVYTNGTSTLYTPIDDTSKSYAMADFESVDGNPDLGALPAGYALLPSYIFSFVTPVPEPASGVTLVALCGLATCAFRRRAGA